MNREILFRGKRIDNGDWVEGSLVINRIEKDRTIEQQYHIQDITYGVFPNDFMSGFDEIVDPSTVCQYTGLTDKNGKKIFEWDRVNRNGKQATVVFDESEFSLAIDGNQYIQHGLLVNLWKNVLEVIGNIHDNPELKEG